MRKGIWTTTLLALSMLCLGGCGKELTAEEVLTKANEKQKTVTSMDADATMDMSMEIAGQSIEYDADLNIKANNLNSADLVMAMDMNMSILGEEMVMQGYYQDGYYYVDGMGEKVKMEMDITEAQEMMSQNSAFSEIPMEAYKSLEMTEENGMRVLTYVADGSMLTELVDSLTGGMMGNTLGDLEDMDMTLGDVSGQLTVDDDFNIVAQTMKMDMSVNIEGMEMSASVDMDMTINNPGEEVVIETPTDLDAYEEVEE